MRVRQWRWPLAVLVFAAAALVLAGCGGGESEKSDAKSSSGSSSSSKASGGEETITVSMKDNFFEPKEITVERGHTITFVAKNDGQAIHDLHIMSASVEGKDFLSNPVIQAGESNTFKATFAKAGTLKFQCDYHLPDMVGTITVK